MKSQLLDDAKFRIDENSERIEKCLSLLNEDEVWHQANTSTNSIANLILHLCGNIRQYIIAGLGSEPDYRQRELEFAARNSHTIHELLEELSDTAENAKEVISALEEDDLIKMYSIQGFNLSGISVIVHVVEHYSYHCGQIALLTKLIKNQDLGFYDGQNLNLTLAAK